MNLQSILEPLPLTDQEKYKLVLIDDIIRAKKHLWAMGKKEHNEFLTDNGRTALFDELYDLDILPLEITMKGYERQINEIMHAKFAAL